MGNTEEEFKKLNDDCKQLLHSYYAESSYNISRSYGRFLHNYAYRSKPKQHKIRYLNTVRAYALRYWSKNK